MSSAHQVLCNHLAIAMKKLSICANLSFACAQIETLRPYPTPEIAGTSTDARMAPIQKINEMKATTLAPAEMESASPDREALRWTTAPSIAASTTIRILTRNVYAR